ncbi:hypothetical protein M153_1522000791 [Pseudoloma neurophilia]|uniref:Uncharacterized protein n=1 Tax=Pseudoloma neurophilia TaxID=146866 RepID=A0A0R0M2S1_9MICR|nr:hypothetical protein M153_1522000791 [Pseudoloma neurophilia]
MFCVIGTESLITWQKKIDFVLLFVDLSVLDHLSVNLSDVFYWLITLKWLIL